MIEPTKSESKEEMDLFIEAMKSIAEEVEEDPQTVLDAPHSTRVFRLDETAAARKPVLRWKPMSSEQSAMSSAGTEYGMLIAHSSSLLILSTKARHSQSGCPYAVFLFRSDIHRSSACSPTPWSSCIRSRSFHKKS